MLASIARAIFGSSNDRSLKGYQRRVPAINALEDGMKALSDEALAAKTVEFRARLADGAIHRQARLPVTQIDPALREAGRMAKQSEHGVLLP